MMKWIILLIVFAAAAPSLAQVHGVIEGKPVVLDGDTLLFGKTRVDLWGIDAPEMDDWPLGANARLTLDVMIAFFQVRCRPVSRQTESPIVARCVSVDSLDKSEVRDLSESMVFLGWAVVDRLMTAHDEEFRKRYDEAEMKAWLEKRGIWGPIASPR